MTEVVVLDVLAGAANHRDEEDLRHMLLGWTMLPLNGLDGFEKAPAIFRHCRAAGERPSNLFDCLVAVPAIAAGPPVLSCGRDFDVLARSTSLQVVSLDE